ncbi:hypothetical protein K8R14_01955 [bacterium]|nr:hypothetical protein [bacterium]
MLRRKRAGKHDFQNNSLRFDMHKIVAGIEQKKIVVRQAKLGASYRVKVPAG